jgi:predicted nucleotidyltransferase
MKDTLDSRLSYFISTATEHLGNNLLGIALTDSFLRQPDYSSRGITQLYLVVRDESKNIIFVARYLQAEFPELIFNYVTLTELKKYPQHCIWQFSTAPWIYGQNFIAEVLNDMCSDDVEGVRQALFGVTHAARLYYLRKLPAKTHTWGVRQLGWALRCAEMGICNLTFQLEKSRIEPMVIPVEIEKDINWLFSCNRNWHELENKLLNKIDKFRNVASRLNKIAVHYVNHIETIYPQIKYKKIIAKPEIPSTLEFVLIPLIEALKSALGEQLHAVYLHGSAARGDMRPGSDIDSIAIVDRVDQTVLEAIRVIQEQINNLTISIFSLNEINQYPAFRQYALINGVIRIFGNIAFDMSNSTNNDLYGILNNIYIIKQISRGYLISAQYGPRAHYMLSLMMKLADHGCLRPMKKLEMGIYEKKKESIKIYFSDQPEFSTILDYVSNLSDNEKEIQKYLLQGDSSKIEYKFKNLLNFSNIFINRLDKFKSKNLL